MIPAVRTLARRLCPLLLAGSAWTLISGGPASAEEVQSGHADPARELAGKAATEPADETLDAWSRSVIERALEQAKGDAGPAQEDAGADLLSGFRLHAEPDGLKGDATVEVLLFTSLAVPAPSWRAAARDAARIGAPLVLRGVAEGGLPATARRITARLEDANAGVAIDPRLFRLFGIARVPAVVVVPGGVPPCRSRGCADDPAPPFDVVAGNRSLAAALAAVAAEGGVARATARRHLATLGGTEP